MKKLSDYQGDEAIELWTDLLDPLANIISNESVKEVVQSGKPKLVIAKEVIRTCKDDAVTILERIDPEPINGLNIITRLISLLGEIGQNDELKAFFGFAEQAQTESESGGSVMENIEVAKK